MTSGEYCRNILNNKALTFKININPQKYFLIGKQNTKLFETGNYKEVLNIKEADFIYLSAPFITDDEYNKMNSELKNHLVELKKANGINPWRAIDLLPVMDKIDLIINSKLPVLSCNPDYTSLESAVDGSIVSIINQGLIVKYLKEKDVEVVEFGKPYINIYEFVLDDLVKKGIVVKKENICMVGDTLRTDIKGANNVEIKSILCLETGITSSKLKEGQILDNLIKQENVVVDYLIKRVANC